MPVTHGKTTRVFVGRYGLSPFLSEASTPSEVEASEVTNFDSGGVKEYIAGLADATLSLSGYHDGSPDAVGEAMDDLRGEQDVPAAVVFGSGVGASAWVTRGQVTSAEVSSAVGDVNSVSLEVQSSGGIHLGVLLAELREDDTDTWVGPSVDDGAATTNGYAVYVSVPTNLHDDDTEIKVQHSANDSTWADLETVVVDDEDTNSWWIVGAGTVNRYVRATIETFGTGDVHVFVAVARL